MTAIAYRDGTMAADTMVVWDDLVKQLNEKKITREQGHLIGIAGDKCPSHAVFVKWLFGSRKRSLSKFKFDAMVVTPAGEIQIWDQTGECEVVEHPFWAIGSGREVCLGAMEQGADALFAVSAAIKWCPTVGGDVMTMHL